MTEDQLVYSKIDSPSKRNLYEIHVTAMHGDADMFTRSIGECYGIDDFLSKIQILQNQMALLLSSYQYLNSEKYTEWVEEQMNWLDIEYDVTTGSQYFAKLDSIEMFYYDDECVQYKVTIKK